MNTRLDRARRTRERDFLAAGAVVDVLVVGGGVTGAGVALDAASRGLTVALCERGDLASGTSAASSKLVHGGLRYLAAGDFALAAESARERHLLLCRIAPHLVRPLPMAVPLTPDLDRTRARLAAVGHRVADGLTRAAGTSPATLPGSRRTGVVETMRLLPALRRDGLRGGLLHWDGQLEDDARLVVALARTAAGYGARILTRTDVSAVDATGALVGDRLDGGTFTIRARHVVNAAGIWSATLDPSLRLRPSKGCHLVLPAAALGYPSAAMTVPVPGQHNRFVLAVPHPDGLVWVGLTDDEVAGPVPDSFEVTAAETTFLLDTLSRALANPVDQADVIGSFAGARPLLGGDGDPALRARTADLSRRHAVHRGPGGLWTVTGGKLTTYRRMAQDVVDRLTTAPCLTRTLPLVGAGVAGGAGGAGGALPARLVRRYGNEAEAVAACADGDPELLRPAVAGCPVLGCELVFGARWEGALDAADLLGRRTRAALVTGWGEALTPLAEHVIARECGAAGAAGVAGAAGPAGAATPPGRQNVASGSPPR